MKNLPTLLVVLLLTSSFVAAPLPAQWLSAQPQRLQAKAMYIYEDNVAYVVQEGPLKFRSKRAKLEEIPNAIYGTYNILPVGDFKITQTLFAYDTISQRSGVRNYFDVLQANVGQQAEVTYRIEGDIEAVVGEIMPFIPGSNLAPIRQPNGYTNFIRKDQIIQVAVYGSVSSRFQERRIGKSMTIEINRDLYSATVRQVSFQKGLSWIPSYTIKLIDDTSASITLGAVINNDAGAFSSADIKLVSGSPNLRYGNLLDPIAQEVDDPYINEYASDEELQERMRENRNQARQAVKQLEADAGEGEVKGLFVYDAGKIALEKNTQVYVPVLQEKINAEARYAGDIPQLNPRKDSTYGEVRYDIELFKAIRLRNETSNSFMSGPAVVLNEDDLPMGQGQIDNLVAGGNNVITLSRSTEVTAFCEEEVENTESKAKKLPDKTRLDRIHIKGKLEISNNGPETIKTYIEKLILGEFTRTGGAYIQKDRASDGYNLNSKATWQIRVQPGQTQRIGFEYDVFVPAE